MIYKDKDLSKLMRPEGRYTFSPEQILSLKNNTQDRGALKPVGLWYACGDEWLNWVRSNVKYWSEEWTHLYEVLPTNAILHVSTEDELRAFAARYTTKGGWGISIEASFRITGRRRDSFNPDWEKLAEDFPGLEICPHQGGMRYELMWYSVWDVASGCIWNERGLDHLKLIARRVGANAWEGV